MIVKHKVEKYYDKELAEYLYAIPLAVRNEFLSLQEVAPDSSGVGMASLRYQNRRTFESKLEEYKVYEKSMVGRHMDCMAVSMIRGNLHLSGMKNLRW